MNSSSVRGEQARTTSSRQRSYGRRAVELLDEAFQQTILVNAEGVGTLGSDPFLLPLRQYAPFRKLLAPAATNP